MVALERKTPARFQETPARRLASFARARALLTDAGSPNPKHRGSAQEEAGATFARWRHPAASARRRWSSSVRRRVELEFFQAPRVQFARREREGGRERETVARGAPSCFRDISPRRWMRDEGGEVERDAKGEPVRESNARVVRWHTIPASNLSSEESIGV